MTLYSLLMFQHSMGWLIPTLIFIVVFGVGLAFRHLEGSDSEERKNTIVARYPEGLEGRNAPFPLIMVLLVAGVAIWGFFYIVLHGVLGVKV
jgi:hypothetical protein